METLIVILIVGAAVFWALRRFSRLLRGKSENSCGCSCNGCQTAPLTAEDTRTRVVQTQAVQIEKSPDPE